MSPLPRQSTPRPCHARSTRPPTSSRAPCICSPPLARPSRLTSKERGGVGKDLSGGWSLNFAVVCKHGCPFRYVDSIHKRFGASRYGRAVTRRWGDYFLVPGNLGEASMKRAFNCMGDI